MLLVLLLHMLAKHKRTTILDSADIVCLFSRWALQIRLSLGFDEAIMKSIHLVSSFFKMAWQKF